MNLAEKKWTDKFRYEFRDWVVFHRVCPLVFKNQIEDNILKKWIECFNASDMVTLFIILSGWLSA